VPSLEPHLARLCGGERTSQEPRGRKRCPSHRLEHEDREPPFFTIVNYEQVLSDAEAINDGWGVYYNQRDTRWAATSVGAATYPVWKIGCLVSDLAMVYSHFGYRSMTPASIAAHSE